MSYNKISEEILATTIFGSVELNLKYLSFGASLVAQWLRICLPMQGTQAESWSRKIPHAAEQLGP